VLLELGRNNEALECFKKVKELNKNKEEVFDIEGNVKNWESKISLNNNLISNDKEKEELLEIPQIN
jgi:hypothetical protein